MIEFFAHSLKTGLQRLLRDESGATAIEYAMIASLIGAVIAATIFQSGGFLDPYYQAVIDAFAVVGF